MNQLLTFSVSQLRTEIFTRLLFLRDYYKCNWQISDDEIKVTGQDELEVEDFKWEGIGTAFNEFLSSMGEQTVN